MKFPFIDNSTGEDAVIDIFPMNLGNVIKLGEAISLSDADLHEIKNEAPRAVPVITAIPTLLETAFNVKDPIKCYKAKLDIVLMCTDESRETLNTIFNPIVLVECFTKCMKLSGFELSTPGEKKTVTQ